MTNNTFGAGFAIAAANPAPKSGFVKKVDRNCKFYPSSV